MKQTVRLRRGLYVLMDSYTNVPWHKRFKLSFPFFFCLTSCIVGLSVLNYVEQQSINCQPNAHHDHSNYNSTRSDQRTDRG